MPAEQRIQLITERLSALNPTHLEIIDESHMHVGHEGAKGGAGHFRVIIASEQFKGIAPLARHRLVYDLVDDLIPHRVHALAIQAKTNP